MAWSAFLHSIQLNENLAPTMSFAGAVKMATLKLHLNPGQSPNGQHFVLRKAAKKNIDGPMHSQHWWGLGYVALSPPLRWPGSGLLAVPSSQRPWAQCRFWLGTCYWDGEYGLKCRSLGVHVRGPDEEREHGMTWGEPRPGSRMLSPGLTQPTICSLKASVCMLGNSWVGRLNPDPKSHVDTSSELWVASLCPTASWKCSLATLEEGWTKSNVGTCVSRI